MTAPRPRPPGWWYPRLFVGGFAVVLVVNATMVWFAATTFPGLATEDAYRKGVAYNDALAAAHRQEALGWQVDLAFEAGPPGSVAATYRDRDGRPVDGLGVTARLIRPMGRGLDRDLPLAALGPGLYGAPVVLAARGQWDVELLARGPDGAVHQMRRRFVVP